MYRVRAKKNARVVEKKADVRVCGGKEKKDDSHLRSVNWWRRHDFPTPMSPMMMYLKMNSYGNDIAAVAVVAGLSLLRGKNEAKKKRVKKKAITHSKKRGTKKKRHRKKTPTQQSMRTHHMW